MLNSKLKFLVGESMFYILIFSMTILMCSCQKKQDMLFGLLLPSFNDAYFVEARQHFENSINEMGGKVITYDGQNNEALQMKQASDLIKAGVSVIVIDAINANSAAAIVREAHENNVKVLAYDRLILNCDLDYYVTYNSVKIGEQMANYALKKNPKGNYVLFYGDASDMNAGFLKEGFFNVLQGPIDRGDVKILYQTYIENWSGVNAYKKMSKILSFSDQYPDVLLSSYDGMSTGSIAAMDDAGIGQKILVTGQNGEIEAFRNILRGRQAMTIYKPVKLLAEKSATIAWNMAKNKKMDETEEFVDNRRIKVKSVLLDAFLIDQQNIKAEIIDKGVFSSEQLNADVLN